MNENLPRTVLEGEVHYCAVHPQRDTELRCNHCERYMCIDCAQRTPVGYTCRECVRGHEDKFFEGTTVDYAVVGAVSLLGGALAVFISLLVGGFLIVGIVLAPALGGVIAQLALTLTSRRRGRQSGYVCAGAVLIGGFVAGLLLSGLSIITLLYLGLAASAAYARFRVAI